MIELITDRTQAHVDRLKRLREKGWLNLSASEKAEWYDIASKGAYNYTDLNRVESAVAEIAEALGITLSTKTNWTMWDYPTRNEMSRYLGNVGAIRDACPNAKSIPSVPLKMTGLTFDMANRIEEILLAARRSADSISRCGELFCGEV